MYHVLFTHLPLDKMVAIWQTRIINALSWIKNIISHIVLLSQFHLRALLMFFSIWLYKIMQRDWTNGVYMVWISSNGSDNGLAPSRRFWNSWIPHNVSKYIITAANAKGLAYIQLHYTATWTFCPLFSQYTLLYNIQEAHQLLYLKIAQIAVNQCLLKLSYVLNTSLSK